MDNENTGYYLKQIFNNTEKLKNNMLNSVGITSSQADLLLYLIHSKNQNINQRDLENHFNYSNATISKMLGRLIEKGLVVREISEEDARSKIIILTGKAIHLERVMRKKFTECEKILLKGMNIKDKIYLNHLLKIIDSNLYEEIKKGKKNNENVKNS